MSFPRLPAVLLLSILFPLAAQAQAPAASAPQSSPAAKPASTKPFLTVNGYAVPQSMADGLVAELKARGAEENDELKRAVREEMIRRGALLSEAKKQGVDKAPGFKQQVQDATQMLLMRNVVANYLNANPPTDAELRAAYDALLVQLGNSEYKLRGLRLKNEADAGKVIASLKDGKKFDKLVKEYAEEADKDKKGDMGWNAPAALPAAVASAIRSLKKGEYTQSPVQLDTGWHVFLVEELRPLTPPSFEQARPQLAQGVVQMKVAQYIETLRTKAEIK
ncbi:MAG: peptidyl-prolyl cis-trans isomerase [Azoarcus sp.]|jgi:peptidyl-prolyl cis-trans isomerase C|nr:peptidyl-prolyl cis-trans isomerase [Azoarcus sp.]